MNQPGNDAVVRQKFQSALAPINLLNFKSRSSSELGQCLASRPMEIVSVGRDQELLRLREKLLSGLGSCIQSMLPESAEEKARSERCRLWLFCNTIELGELVYLATSIRRYSPGSRLVLIEGVRPVRFESVLFDRILRASDSVDTLLAAVSGLAATA